MANKHKTTNEIAAAAARKNVDLPSIELLQTLMLLIWNKQTNERCASIFSSSYEMLSSETSRGDEGVGERGWARDNSNLGRGV